MKVFIYANEKTDLLEKLVQVVGSAGRGGLTPEVIIGKAALSRWQQTPFRYPTILMGLIGSRTDLTDLNRLIHDLSNLKTILIFKKYSLAEAGQVYKLRPSFKTTLDRYRVELPAVLAKMATYYQEKNNNHNG